MNLLPAFTVVGHTPPNPDDDHPWESWWVEKPGDGTGDPPAYMRIVVGPIPEWLGHAHTEVRVPRHVHGDPSLECTDPGCQHVGERFRHAGDCAEVHP